MWCEACAAWCKPLFCLETPIWRELGADRILLGWGDLGGQGGKNLETLTPPPHTHRINTPHNLLSSRQSVSYLSPPPPPHTPHRSGPPPVPAPRPFDPWAQASILPVVPRLCRVCVVACSPPSLAPASEWMSVVCDCARPLRCSLPQPSVCVCLRA